MPLQALYHGFKSGPSPSVDAYHAWCKRLSVMDWAWFCRLNDLCTIGCCWPITDADGLILTYTWPLHDLRHRLRRTDPTEWLIAMIDLERTRDIPFFSYPCEDGWELGEHYISLHGARRLVTRFGLGKPWWEDRWSCEDCLCELCGAPTKGYPFTTCSPMRPCVALRQRANGQQSTAEDW